MIRRLTPIDADAPTPQKSAEICANLRMIHPCSFFNDFSHRTFDISWLRDSLATGIQS